MPKPRKPDCLTAIPFLNSTGIKPPENEEVPMNTRRYWPVALLLLAVSLSACSGNHKFKDDDYRPLGDPQSVNRGE
tara:strand:+ start:193 stop:420 length:228 start_codon:yes stop_codon:yes gene_type:complete